MSHIIISAVYGSVTDINGKSINVTDKVQQLVSSGKNKFKVSNDNFSDPNPGTGKCFTILYYHKNGRKITLSIDEGNTIDLDTGTYN